MSLDRLKSLYTYSGTEYSLSSASLQILKHVLLLKIKASPDATITVDGITYTKGDIIKIIDADYDHNSFDPEKLWNAFPELQNLQEENGITSYFQGDSEAFLNHEHAFEAQNYLSEKFARQLEKEIRHHIQHLEFLPAAQRTSYLFAFDDETRLRMQRNIKNEIRQIFDASKPLHSFEFMVWEPYYKILEVVANDDIDFLLLQYNTGLKQVSKLSYDQGSTFFQRQQKLGFDAFILDQIKEHENEFFKAAKSGRSQQGGISGRFVLIVIIVILKIVLIASHCSDRRSTNRTYTTNEAIERFRNLQENRGYGYNPKKYYTPPTPSRIDSTPGMEMGE